MIPFPMTNNLFSKLFGKPVSVYTDDDAIKDGLLIPFIDRDRDTGHRITAAAWEALTTYHRNHDYPDHEDEAFYRLFYAGLAPLIDGAHHSWNYSDILTTDYTFTTHGREEGILWYVPNERGGITLMLPADY